MDGIAEKFSLFDYLNSLIGGFVFLLGFGICEYPDSSRLMKSWAATIGESTFLLILSLISLVAVSFVMGAVVNAMSEFFFKTLLGLEKKAVEGCLTDQRVVGNPEKLNRYKEKANAYFFPADKQKAAYKRDECADYFAHCVYFIQIRNQNRKPERLREVQGLSMLLSGVFALLPGTNLFFAAFSHTLRGTAWIKLWIYPLSLLLAALFGVKYRKEMYNRIRMVLAIYDVCLDQEIVQRTQRAGLGANQHETENGCKATG